jgi:hypothetical protein
MKTRVLAVIALLFSAVSVNCQNKETLPEANEKNKPKIDIKVNKQYDDKGNVIGYDSTYSYIYSDSAATLQNDSMFSNFHNFPGFQFHSFNNMPLNIDSLMKQNPFSHGFNFNDPFFDNNFNMNQFDDMNKILRKLDSLNRSSFNRMQPPDKNKSKSPKQKQEAPKPEIKNDIEEDNAIIKEI